MAEDVFGIVGTNLKGNFHVETVVAEGGFGVVYRAQHGTFRAPVALKCLKIPDTMTVEQRDIFLEKFREEAELLFRLSAYIGEVVRPLHADVMHLPGGRVVPFLALEWLEGESFERILSRRRKEGRPVALHKLVKMLRPIAQALARAHHFPGPSGPISIVHCDLKPDNIFVSTMSGMEKVKILDFGIARAKSAATQSAGRATEGGFNAFTPGYGAPEQWVPKRFGQTGPWTDVWGLAITMVEALAGRAPIDGEIAAMMGTTLDERRRPTPRNEGVVVSPEVDRVFERALAVDPRERTKDIETFWTELEIAMGLPATFASRDRRRDSIAASFSPPSDRPTALGGLDVPMLLQERELSDTRALGAKPQSDAAPVAVPVAAPAGPSQAPKAEAAHAPTVPGGSLELALEIPSLAPAPMSVPELAPAAPPAPPPMALPQLEPLAPPAAQAGPAPAPMPVQMPRQEAAPPMRPATGLSPFDDDLPGGEIHLAAPVPRSSASFERRPLAEDVGAASSITRQRPRRMAHGPAFAPMPDGYSTLRERLRKPVILTGIAFVIAAIDMGVAAVEGTKLFIGPIRPYWVAVPLAVIGVSIAFWQLLSDKDDE